MFPRTNEDWYLCNECMKPYKEEHIYNIMSNYFICYKCLPEKLVANVLKK